MTHRPVALLMLPFAALCIVAACSGDLAGPDGEGRSVRPRRTAIDTTVACSDSVVAGYGNCCTGGIDYEVFEYDPLPGTEYVCSEDPATTCPGMTSTTCEPEYTPPPPPPAPTSPSPTPTSPTGTR